jgi:quinoprotein glucose dehydrogenase
MGDEKAYPSLLDVQNRMTKDEILNKIRQGSARMPAFSAVVKGQEESIIAFLFQQRDKKTSRENADISEIRKNKLSYSNQDDSTLRDTFSMYLNVTAYAEFRDNEDRHAIKPPWGTLSAINVSTGAYEWKIPVGNEPELQQKDAPATGSSVSPGPVVTAGGVVFLTGTADKKIFAYDKSTGKVLWQATLPAVGSSTPCVYMSDGKQYVALSVAGDKTNPSGYIVAFALP